MGLATFLPSRSIALAWVMPASLWTMQLSFSAYDTAALTSISGAPLVTPTTKGVSPCE